MAAADKRSVVTKRSRGPKIGKMLLEHGYVTPEQLDHALELQEASGQPLGAILVKLGYVSDLNLVRVLADHFDLEFVDLDQCDIDPSAVDLVKEPFARYHQLLPLMSEGDELVVAMVNPTNLFALDDVRTATGMRVRPLMAEPAQLTAAIDAAWRGSDRDGAILLVAEDDLDATNLDEDLSSDDTGDAPIVQFVNQLITRAVRDRASDIHLDAHDQELCVRFRVDGVLHEVLRVPRAARGRVISRLKIMAEINIAERRVPQDGRVSITLDGRPISLRVVTLPTAYGESMVIRVLEESGGVRDLAELGMRPAPLAVFESAFRRPWGAVLVTGPTGSGKSTTMYATLVALNDPGRNIISVEDPIEYRLAGVKQMQVHRKAGLTFPTALRSVLRADPDVVLVGEVRDVETATIVVEAALTGHLVITSLHTNDAASTPLRLLDMGIEPFMVTGALNAIVAQRLARRLCEGCKEEHDPRQDAVVAAGLPEWARDGDAKFFRPVGCDACGRTGYLGRMALHEVLAMSPEIDQMIVGRATARDVKAQAEREGMVAMREDGLHKAAAGDTSIEEVVRAVG